MWNSETREVSIFDDSIGINVIRESYVYCIGWIMRKSFNTTFGNICFIYRSVWDVYTFLDCKGCTSGYDKADKSGIRIDFYVSKRLEEQVESRDFPGNCLICM